MVSLKKGDRQDTGSHNNSLTNSHHQIIINKLREILQLFQELEDKRKGTEYLEVLLRYLTSSARDLTEEDIKESVTQILAEGGDRIMATIAERWVEKGRSPGDR